MESKYLGKTYCGWKVISFKYDETGHRHFTLKKLAKKITVSETNLLKLARHETTVKKLLNK